jgi:hypothetical protein
VGWTLISAHGLVLLAIARDPAVTMRQVAQQVGVTERAVQRHVRDLVEAGYLERWRDGRQNRYTVHLEKNLPHPTTCRWQVDELFALLCQPPRRHDAQAEPDQRRSGGTGGPKRPPRAAPSPGAPASVRAHRR